MTQEEKQLVLKDLCARLPYGVKLTTDYTNRKTIYILRQIFIGNFEPLAEVYTVDDSALMDRYNVSALIPYLRPMSSMTEEEKEYMEELSTFKCTPDKARMKIDFYLKNHIDYRGLIPMGLALEAPEGMYKI